MFKNQVFAKWDAQKGFSFPELLIVLFIIGIIAVLVMPQITSSRRLFRFAGVQRQLVSVLREARQEAMSQRKPITFRYDNTNKTVKLFGGTFGNAGDSKNRVIEFTGDGVNTTEVIYGRPPGSPVSALGDGANLTALDNNFVDITFQSSGTVLDSNNNPQNKALFFYNSNTPAETAFAVSVLGAGGRVKTWRYNQGANLYVE